MDRWLEYWFACLDGISSARKVRIRKDIVSLESLYNIEETALKALSEAEIEKIISSKKRNWKEEYHKNIEEGIHLVTCMEKEYPQRLYHHKGMPYGIFYKGKLPPGDTPTVGIVGARRCTAYGEKMTLEFAELLAAHGAAIISGMARGVDGIAHRGALNVKGETYAVLGCGVDICYPSVHRGLYGDILELGGILSEYPPGTPPLARNFPARNRIISGLSDKILVMEAKEKSGSLITADMALEQGKDVYALPGNIVSELSAGCNQLIYQGAGILLNPEFFVKELVENGYLISVSKAKDDEKNKIKLERDEKVVYSCLDFYPKNKEQILNETRLTPQQLNCILVSLELKGYVEERYKNYYIKRK